MRHHLHIACLVFLFSCSPKPIGDVGELPKALLEKGLFASFPEFESITVMPHHTQKSLLAINFERYLKWSGQLVVLDHANDKVNWVATLPVEYIKGRGSYVLSVRWVHLAQIDAPVLEVFDCTHMGNGSIWLFALEKQQFRVLLNTTAVDNHNDVPDFRASEPPLMGDLLEGGSLNAEYRVPAGGKFEDCLLSGTTLTWNHKTEEFDKAPYSETWRWNADEKVFKKAP